MDQAVGMLDDIKNWITAKINNGTASSKPKTGSVALEKRFDLSQRLGQGSMSKVWRATDRISNETVCVKILDVEKTEKFESRFKGLNKPTEGQICVQLQHENIVKTLEHGISTNNEPYLVMELIHGVGLNYMIDNLHDRMQGNRINLLMQITSGLEAVHKKGFLHRDLCPRNIMVDNDNVVKLIDFGLAVPYKPNFCKPGNRTGTKNYLAPELIRRQPTDHRVDLFALGVTAFEVFTHELPWEKGPAEKLLRSMVNSPARNPKHLQPNLDSDIAEFLTKAVERDPKDRFQSIDEFRKALQELSEP